MGPAPLGGTFPLDTATGIVRNHAADGNDNCLGCEEAWAPPFRRSGRRGSATRQDPLVQLVKAGILLLDPAP